MATEDENTIDDATSIFSCCMYKIADEIVLLSLKQASALVNKSMDPLL